MLDIEKQTGEQLFDWSNPDINWSLDENGGDRGLRGVGFDADKVYIATSDALLACSPDFQKFDRFPNRYLQEAHGVFAWQRTLYITSAGYDSVLGFDLDQQEYTWAMQVKSQRHRFLPSPYDPNSDDGPLMLKKLHLDCIHCNEHGMYLAGQHTNGLLHFNGEQINLAVEMPVNCHDVLPFRSGIVFNDIEASALRYTERGEGEEDRAMPLPESSTPGSARGLCVLNEHIVAGGSAPATVAIYDLAANEMLGSVQLSNNPDHSIHSIVRWPFN